MLEEGGLATSPQVRYTLGVAGEARGEVTLRPLERSDLDAVFEQMRDPRAVDMAAFTAADPDDRAAFDRHWERVLATPENVNVAILLDGRLAGTAAAFVVDGDTEVTYWVHSSAWGRGVATRALALLLRLVPTRPLHARAASDNVGSLRVLEHNGFRVVGTDAGYAPGRGAEVQETVLRLD